MRCDDAWWCRKHNVSHTLARSGRFGVESRLSAGQPQSAQAVAVAGAGAHALTAKSRPRRELLGSWVGVGGLESADRSQCCDLFNWTTRLSPVFFALATQRREAGRRVANDQSEKPVLFSRSGERVGIHVRAAVDTCVLLVIMVMTARQCKHPRHCVFWGRKRPWQIRTARHGDGEAPQPGAEMAFCIGMKEVNTQKSIPCIVLQIWA